MTNMFMLLKSTTCTAPVTFTTVCRRCNTDTGKWRTQDPLAVVVDWQTISLHGYWYYLK